MIDENSSQPDVELRSVTKRFGDVIAVDDISLKIWPGEFFSLLGPSGCGKTTTLRMVAGFAHPTAGDVLIKGRRVNGVPAYNRDTNLVFQQLALFPHMDVFDNVAFGPAVKRKLDRSEVGKRVRKVLDLVELGGLERRRIQQLSGGQQQRVAIARALINEPSVLLLDEPLGALDLKLRLQMQIELKALQQRVGTTFIYVTHDQGEAITMSDRIAVMKDGRVEQLDSSEKIYSRPATKFVAQFIGDTNLLEGRLLEDENDGTAVFEAKGLKIRVARNSELKGSASTVSLRPEKIKIAGVGSANGGDNRFEGRIFSATFMGSIIRYEIVLDNELKLLVETPNEAGQIFNQGDKAAVAWAKESCVLVSGE
jgi:spermidine/putrescine transport system ATP-binding protein